MAEIIAEIAMPFNWVLQGNRGKSSRFWQWACET